MERKDTGKNILIAFLIIIIILLVGFIAFNLGKDNSNNENNKDNVVDQSGSEDSTETVDYNDYIHSGTKLAQADVRKIKLNGKEHNLTLVYSYKIDKEQFQDFEYDVYAYYLTVLYDNKLTNISNLEIAKEDVEYTELITDFKDKYVKTIVMNDQISNEQYLAFAIETSAQYGEEIAYYTAIYNEKEKIFGFNSKSGCIPYNLNDTRVSFVELSSNSLKYIEVISNRDNDGKNDIAFLHQYTITMENGQYKTQLEDVTNKLTIAGVC